MPIHIISQRTNQTIIFTAAAVIILLMVNQAQTLIAMMLFSFFAALIGTPPVQWLERHHIPSLAAVAIVMLGIIALLVIVGGVVAGSVNMFSTLLPSYQARIQEQMLAIKPWLTSRNITLNDTFIVQYINPGIIMGLAVNILQGFSLALSNIIIVLLTVLFILIEASGFPLKLRAILGDPHRNFSGFTLFINDVERYLVIKTFISAVTGILITVWLTFLGVDSPVLWGFLAFLFNYIPNVGSTLAAIPAVLLAFVQLGTQSALLATAGYMTINVVLDNVIETKMMGTRLGLSTLVVFISLILWGSLLGSIGMVLCIPLTMTVKFACEQKKELHWIAVLLGPEDENPVSKVKAAVL
ncbi:MAG: AI-2E family transporter [Bacteroidetes bacterium]|nr:AI-2E family transporter [Bacteroidota bacterium]